MSGLKVGWYLHRGIGINASFIYFDGKTVISTAFDESKHIDGILLKNVVTIHPYRSIPPFECMVEEDDGIHIKHYHPTLNELFRDGLKVAPIATYHILMSGKLRLP